MNLPRMTDGLPDGVVVTVTINVHASGAMSVAGPIHDKRWMIALLENAKDAVRNHGNPGALIVPSSDVSLG